MGRSLFLLRASQIVLSLTLISGLTGCGDITGDSPEIASKDKKAAESKSTPTQSATPSPTSGSGWNNAADRVFGNTAPGVVAGNTTATAGATTQPVSSEPVAESLTAPDPALAEASGLFLRQAQDAKVFWRTWSPEAFREARTRNLPMIIVIGSAWSHDARIMDDQVFSDPEISEILNQRYVPVRVDADERPDIWSRYRLAYEVINKQRARPPLVVFALSDGRPFDVVGAVPARSAGDGSAGLLQLLTQASNIVSEKPADVTAQAASIESVLSQLLTAPRAESADLSEDLLQKMATELATATKGDLAEALRAGRVGGYLMHDFASTGRSDSRNAASDLLLSRFRSGQRDHVMGGYFFRLPGSGDIQFGKLLPVQTEMIEANSRAYAVTGKGLHKEAVTEVLRFCRDWLESPDGGFFVCQAPDIGGDDSGSYFTWSREEINEIAGEGAAATVFSEYLNAQAEQKTNLHVTDRLQSAADVAGVSYEEALKGLDDIRAKLHDARMSAENVPMVDKSIIAGWNGDMICAYLDAAKFIGDDKAKEFALKTADLIIESMVSEKDGVARVLYKGKATGFGYLEDNVKVAAALLKCYQATQQQEYLDSARSLMVYVESRFLDKDSGLYQDVVMQPSMEPLGLLKLKRLPLEDDISRSVNAVAAIAWYELFDASKDDNDKARAERLVQAAVQRRPFTTEAVVTWGEAGLLLEKGTPEYKQ